MTTNPPPPSATAWRQRVDSARALIRHHRHDPTTEARLDRVQVSLDQAAADQASLRQAVAHLDPDRVARELKAAMRATDRSEPLVATLRQRYETVHALQNQLDELSQRIDATVADVETLAARTAQTMLGAGSAPTLDSELGQLNDDLTALAAAHDEIAALDPLSGRNPL